MHGLVRLDAFKLSSPAKTFNTLIDFGLFHQFDGDARVRYVRSLGDV
jgi:hypothetical protein